MPQAEAINEDIHTYLERNQRKELLRFLTCGSVDDGKSTLIGRLLFAHDLLLYLSIILVAVTAYVLARTRLGLILRAVGENHDAAHAIGYPVIACRYGALAFGGEQLLLQHRALFDLLEARAEARGEY